MTLLKNFLSKFFCFFGSHTWQYQVERLYTKPDDLSIDSYTLTNNRLNDSTVFLTTRFCRCCYKKQLRHRNDMLVYYLDQKLPLTKEQTRIKNLNIILNEK